MKKVISLLLSLVMLCTITTGMTFTANADNTIDTIEVNHVPEPYIGATVSNLCYFSVPDWADYASFSSDFTKSMLWYDLSSANPNTALPTDATLTVGHQYKVSVRLMANNGASFAASPNAYINGTAATTSQYLGRKATTNLAVDYTFPTLTKKYINWRNVEFEFGDFEKGVTVSGSSALLMGDGVKSVSVGWFKDGNAVPNNTVVSYGKWGFMVGLVADDVSYFDSNSYIKVNGNEIKATEVLSNGSIAFFRTADDFYNLSCTHNYSSSWSSDGTTHWKECSVCGDKSEEDAHTFDAGVTAGDITTYTCSVCGYKKVDKYVENGFRYADVTGGVQVITYKGSDVNVTVPNTLGGKKVVSIADYAFATATNKTSVKSITLPSTVTTIGRSAFNGCSALTSVNIPSGVTRIEKETFLGCSALGNVTIPFGVTYLGDSAFQSCGISSVVIPCSVTVIGSQVFRNCDNLGSIVVPDSVTSLGDAFMSCDGLKTVVIGDKVTTIAQSTFDACTALETLTLPAGLTSIGKYNLNNKSNFSKIYFRGTSQQWSAVSIASYNTNTATVEYNYTQKTDVGQHKYQVVSVVEPTCISEGFTLNACLGCGDSFKTNPTAATGNHTYKTGYVAKAATCAAEGEFVSNCSVCGDSISTVIPKIDHTWNAGVVTKKATPTATGVKTYTCTVCGAKKTATIAKCAKYANPLTAKAKKPTVKYAKLKKKNQTIAAKNAVTVSKAQGKVTYKKSSGNKKITVAKNGKITVKKGLKKGTYKVKIKVTAAGNATYKSGSKTVTVTIKVK